MVTLLPSFPNAPTQLYCHVWDHVFLLEKEHCVSNDSLLFFCHIVSVVQWKPQQTSNLVSRYVLVYIGLKGQRITAFFLSHLDNIESVETAYIVSPLLSVPRALLHLRWRKNDELLTFTLMEMKGLISIIQHYDSPASHIHSGPSDRWINRWRGGRTDRWKVCCTPYKLFGTEQQWICS